MRKITNRCLLALGIALLPVLVLAGPVNVNTADAETISAELRGIGMTKAQAIVAWRAQNGPFKTVDDLVLVKGIGEKTLELNRADILLDGSAGTPRQ